MAWSERLSRLRETARAGLGVGLPPDLQERVRGCLPPAVNAVLAKLQQRLLVEVHGATATLSLASGPDRETIGILDADSKQNLPRMLEQVAKDRGQLAELQIPGDAVVVRSVSLPSQVRANLAQVVRYELDRLTPFSPDDVFYDYRLLPAPKGSGRLTLDLGLCRRDAVQPWISRLAEMGCPIDQVSWRGGWIGANLLPHDLRPRRERPWVNPVSAVALLGVLLLAAVMVSPVYQKWRYATYLEDEVRKAQTQAIAVDDLRQELDRTRQARLAVVKEKLEQPLLLDLLRELTERLPDDTWVQGLEYDGGNVELRGESSQATALIALLEQAPGIDGVTFKSPVVQVARTGKERFNIGFRYARQVNP